MGSRVKHVDTVEYTIEYSDPSAINFHPTFNCPLRYGTSGTEEKKRNPLLEVNDQGMLQNEPVESNSLLRVLHGRVVRTEVWTSFSPRLPHARLYENCTNRHVKSPSITFGSIQKNNNNSNICNAPNPSMIYTYDAQSAVHVE